MFFREGPHSVTEELGLEGTPGAHWVQSSESRVLEKVIQGPVKPSLEYCQQENSLLGFVNPFFSSLVFVFQAPWPVAGHQCRAGAGAGSCRWRVTGKGLSGETWGWEESRHLMYFYGGEGGVGLGRRGSPELQLCWEGAAQLIGGLILDPSWEGFFWERKGCSTEAEPKARVRAEEKRKSGCVGLENITQCKLSSGSHLLLRGVFSLYTERGSCLWLSLGLALRVKAERKPRGRVVSGLENIFQSKQTWVKAFSFPKAELLFTSAMACSLLTVQIDGGNRWHVSAGLQASSHVLCAVRGSGLSSFMAAVWAPCPSSTALRKHLGGLYLPAKLRFMSGLVQVLPDLSPVCLREGTHLPFMAKHFGFLSHQGSLRCLRGAWPPTGLPKRSEIWAAFFLCVLHDFEWEPAFSKPCRSLG